MSRTFTLLTVSEPTSANSCLPFSRDLQSVSHLYRSTMAWGLEARVPFLDMAFLEAAMNVDPKEKQFSKGSSQEVDQDGCPKMEKYILRKAFDVSPDGKVNL